jgi:hypothetical protein
MLENTVACTGRSPAWRAVEQQQRGGVARQQADRGANEEGPSMSSLLDLVVHEHADQHDGDVRGRVLGRVRFRIKTALLHWGGDAFDPLLPSAVQTFCVARCSLLDHLVSGG